MTSHAGGSAGRGAGEEFDKILGELGKVEVPLDPSFQSGLEAGLRRSYDNPFRSKRTAGPAVKRFAVAFALIAGVLIGATVYGPVERKLGLGTVSAQQVILKAVQISEKIESAVLYVKSAGSIRDIYSGQTDQAVVEEWVDLSDPLSFCRLVNRPKSAAVAQACSGGNVFLYLQGPYNGKPGYLVRLALTPEERDRLKARVLLRQAYIKDAEPHAAKARYIRKETVLDNRPVHTIAYDKQIDNPWSREQDANPQRIPVNVTMKIDSDDYRVLSYVEQAEFNGIWFTTFSHKVEEFEHMGRGEVDLVRMIEEMSGAEVQLMEIPASGRSHYQEYMAEMALAGLGEYFVPPPDLIDGKALAGVSRGLSRVLKPSVGDWELVHAVRLPGSRYRLHFRSGDGNCLTLENRNPYRSLDRSWNARLELSGRPWLVETGFGIEGDFGSEGIFSRDISFLHPSAREPIYIKGRDLTQDRIAEFIEAAIAPYPEDEAQRTLHIPWGDPPILEDLPDASTEMRSARAWRRATLGMAIAPTKDGRGSRVIAVFENGPAAMVGVKEGDRLLYINGVPIANNKSLKEEIDKKRFGERVTLTIERDGRIMEVKPILIRRIYLLDNL